MDMLLTDPPYNVALGYYDNLDEAKKRHRCTDGLLIANDNFEDEGEFTDFLYRSFSNASSVMKKGGAFYIWMASLQSHNFVEACKRTGWQIRQYIVWNKNTFTLGRQDYQWKHELCLYGWEEGAGHYFIDDRKLSTVLKDKTEIEPRKMKKDELVNLVEEMLSDNIATTVMDEDKPMRSEEHPTMKPLKLMGRLIKNSTRQGEAVLDMFGGSGSTLIACEQLGRKCYMMELDEHYTDVIIERWEQFTGKKAILIERDERK